MFEEVKGSQGKLRAPEWWPESCGRGLDEYFLLEAFFCQVLLLSVCLGRVLVFAGGVHLRHRRSQEVRGSQEVQNGGLRALEEAWKTFQTKSSTSYPGGNQVDGLPPALHFWAF